MPGVRDARDVGDTDVEADVCIVGTGAAGTTVALGLRDTGLDVCVLEAGGEGRDDETSSALGLETPGLPIDEASRERYLGGTTNTWWGKWARFPDGDVAPRPWVSLPGWPLDVAELREYTRRAARLVGMPDPTGLEEVGATWRGFVFAGDPLETAAFYSQRPPLNFADVYRRAVAPAPNVTTFLHANVTELVADPSGRRIDRVVARTTAGRSLSVRARRVVLACGGIENARLLLASTGSRPGGIGNEHDQVGRYFMEHPKGPAGVVELVRGARPLPDPAYWWGRGVGRGRLDLGVRLSPRSQRELRVLDSYVVLHPVHPATTGPAAAALREVARVGPRALLRTGGAAAILRDLPSVASYAAFRVLNRGRLASLRIENFMEQEPRAENRVTLGEGRDRFGSRVAAVSWSISELDRRSLRELHRVLDRELRRRELGVVRSPLLDGDDDWPVAKDASHHMGTTRMGTDPRSSVVDARCRVHGVENLFVAGSSVFATSSYANPTLTIVALSLRLADQLRAIDRS